MNHKNNNLNIDPKKLALITEFQKMAKGKTFDEALPLIMAVSQKSKNMGMNFSQDETNMIIETFKADASPAERKKIDMMMSMMSMMK